MPNPRQSTSSDVLTTIPAESSFFPEVLGFTPHFLHDDIFNVVGETVNFAVNAMNEHLDRWATARAARHPDEEWDGAEEIEQGLVAFQTLLDSHVDGAFDFFEIWSLRNIFSVQVGLPLVVPHQAGLDLKQPPEKDLALLAEIEDMRRKLNTMHRIELTFKHAVTASAAQLERSRAKLDALSFLDTHALDTLAALPARLSVLDSALASMPSEEEIYENGGATARSEQRELAATLGKREWEMGRRGYAEWALQRKKSEAEFKGAADGAQIEEERRAAELARAHVRAEEMALADGDGMAEG